MILKFLIGIVGSFAFSADPAPFPVFLRPGFSSVLEFGSMPKKVVVGDAQSFQVERMDKSIVIRPSVTTATSNLLVYFNEDKPKIFLLTASDEAEPTIYRKFEAPVTSLPKSSPVGKGSRLRSVTFSPKKDYLTVEVVVSAGPNEAIRPKWNMAAIQSEKRKTTPSKIWAERTEIQRDSSNRARFVFTRPDLPANLLDAKFILPMHDGKSLTFDLWRK